MPALSRLCASIRLPPAIRLTELFQLAVPLAGCQTPLFTRTSTSANPLLGLPGSLALPLTGIGELLNVCPLVGLEMVTVGTVVSDGLYVTLTEASTE